MTATTLTKDGNLDLVVFTDVMNVFHGDGEGDFTPAGTYAVSAQPSNQPFGAGYLFADVTGDASQDLIVTSSNSDSPGIIVYPGNGDSTFQAPLGTPVSGPVADVNNDGIADMVYYPGQAANYFATALGRGDGSFAILNQTTALTAALTGYVLVPGDFNHDGKVDVVAMQPGPAGHNALCESTGAQLYSYLGSGDGRFQAKGSPLALNVNGTSSAVTGDFNNDGNLDLIIYYSCAQTGSLLVTGKGDGTFADPVNLNAVLGGSSAPIVGDLNHDGNLDLISGGTVSLGNGDGTFRQLPLTIPVGTPAISLADLNGDGILDVISGNSSTGPGLGSSIYAGVGDGTFQATPFYTVSPEPYEYDGFIIPGDLNGDGNPDLLVPQSGINGTLLGVFFGDGHGNFTADTNTYLTPGGNVSAARLNNQAPALPGDNRLDVLLMSANQSGSYYVASLLNLTNSTPAKPSPIASATTLQASVTTAAPGTAIALTVSVSGINPTGAISFVSNGKSLGKETLVNGVATLTTSFANTGSYTLTASYDGDSNNAAGTSPALSVSIMRATSSTTLAATPAAGDVNGQITLQATVSGDSPTGSVTFAAGTSSLGSATLTNGVATLTTSFAAAGSYATTATYQGDSSNSGSGSNSVTVVIAAPDFTLSVTPATQTITSGQTATFTFTVKPVAGFSSAVTFTCGSLPAEAACSFSPASATPVGGSPATSTLTVTTEQTVARLDQAVPNWPFFIPAGGFALAGAMGLIFAPGETRRWNRRMRWLSWALTLASLSLVVAGCGGSTSGPAKTPAGSYTLSVNATNSGGSQHAASITLAVQ